MTDSKENRFIDAPEFADLADKLASKIAVDKTKYDLILCVTGGALPLTYPISKKLGIEMIETYGCSSYSPEGIPLGKLRVFKKPDPKGLAGLNVLVLDDLIDGGGTANGIYNEYKDFASQIDFAVLLTKKGHKCDKGIKIFAVEENINPDQYIDFYYEKPELMHRSTPATTQPYTNKDNQFSA